MPIDRQQIVDTIMAVRPNLSNSSAKTYQSTLANIPRKMNRDDYNGTTWFRDNIADIVQHLDGQTPARRRSVLDALFAVTGDESVLKLGKQESEAKREQSKAEIDAARGSQLDFVG